MTRRSRVLGSLGELTFYPVTLCLGFSLCVCVVYVRVTDCVLRDDPVSIKDSPGWLETVQVEQGRCCVPLASRNGPC